MDKKHERNCYRCTHSGLCFLKRRIERAVIGAWLLDMNASALMQLFSAIAKGCTQFEHWFFAPAEQEKLQGEAREAWQKSQSLKMKSQQVKEEHSCHRCEHFDFCFRKKQIGKIAIGAEAFTELLERFAVMGAACAQFKSKEKE